jgi:hypothetical protein
MMAQEDTTEPTTDSCEPGSTGSCISRRPTIHVLEITLRQVNVGAGGTVYFVYHQSSNSPLSRLWICVLNSHMEFMTKQFKYMPQMHHTSSHIPT